MDAAKSGVFTIVIPFYNEADFIGKTLESLKEQRVKPGRILLVDNGSTDDGPLLCRAFAQDNPALNVEILHEPQPGKIHALARTRGIISTGFVAVCDADTYYPPAYLERAKEIFDRHGPGTAAVLAIGTSAPIGSRRAAFAQLKGAFIGRLLARQCHAGGFGQIFRTKALHDAGWFNAERWPFVLEDHEIIHQVLKFGDCAYDRGLWCAPSARRVDRANVSWNPVEQAAYHLTPYLMKDWYFNRFLAPRLGRRGLTNVRLRNQPWSGKPAQSLRLNSPH